MLRALVTRLREWAERDDDEGFVRSRLDASVLYAHGQGDAEAERELAAVSEEAADLAEAREQARD
ncbi:hypothetical protein [Halorientalis litorea]|jgi:hypothetical protein|uniref:hypothetical protein n=1 Tax=Halorientalis litorea TaxID=2931977 RepID=UPI001FF13109|nr:hypothetical protein [Halorientalis litorea]